jgi:hypothetical protein
MHDVWCHPKQHFAFSERFGHQPKLIVLKIAEAPVNQLAAGGTGSASQIALLHQQYLKAAAGGIARYPGAIDAASNYQQVYVIG